ncbi:MAG: SDR family oxidoreductase [Luteolibacter sp.]
MNQQPLVIVTGASRGLGLAICRGLAAKGYRVVGASRKNSAEFMRLEEDLPSQVFFRPLDLGVTGGHHQWLREIEKEFGSLYALVNNGAMAHDGVLATMHETQIEELIQVNLTGTIILTKYALRSMLPQRRGRVVNIASIIASTGFNGLSVYGATKAALLGFTRSLAREVGRANITVNAISPGYMQTEMSAGLTPDKLESIIRRSPLRKLASVEDVAAGVEYLLSDGAASITGIDLTIDAGSTI